MHSSAKIVSMPCLGCLLPRVRSSAARLCDETVQLGPEAGLSADRFAANDLERFAPTEQKLFRPQFQVSNVDFGIALAPLVVCKISYRAVFDDQQRHKHADVCLL